MSVLGPLLLTQSGRLEQMSVERRSAPDASSFSGKIGWARFAGKVILTEGAHQTQGLGPLLSAEWVETDGRSCKIIADPLHSGQWIELSFPVRDERFEVERVEVQGHWAAKGLTLLYDIYWTDDGEGAVRRALDVFRGFGPAQGRTS